MGSSDPNSVDARDTEYLIGVPAWGDDVSHIEQSDALELIDRSMLPEDRQKVMVRNVRGARRLVDPRIAKARSEKSRKVALRRAEYAVGNMNAFGMKFGYD